MISMKPKFTYVGIRVTDLRRSIDFYTKILGLKVTNRANFEQTKGEIVNLQSEEDGFIIELNYYEESSPYNTKYSVGEGLDHLAFKVNDLDEALEELKKAGCHSILEMNADGNRWVYIEDPDGIWIELF